MKEFIREYVGILLAGIAFLLPMFIAIAIFNYCSQDQSSCRDANTFRRAVEEAAQIDNTIISAREFPNKPNFWKFWRTNKAQEPSLSGKTEVAPSVSTCVVFVHGYNTCFANCIRNGNVLWRAIQALVGVEASAKSRFFTFCWRGDVGTSNFTEANNNAISTAPVFGSFLRNISNAPESVSKRKVFVVTHSLGALVVLEALRTIQDQPGMPIIDTLVLVQPAVRVQELGRGEIEGMTILMDPQVMPPPPPVVSYYNAGQYFDAISKETRRTFATASRADGVLGWAFTQWAGSGKAPEVTSLKTDIAVGSLDKLLSKGWTFPSNLEIVPLSPQLHLQAAVHSHGDLFDPKNRTLIPFLVHKVLEP